MVQLVSINIKTHKHIKAYLEANFGTPVQFKRDSIFLNKLILCLNHNLYQHYDRVGNFPDKLMLKVPIDVYHRYGCYMNDRQEQLFNTFVDKFMKEKFKSHADDYLELMPKKSLKNAIQYALEHMNITDDDWEFETIKRFYHRYRTVNNGPILKIRKKINPKIFGDLVPKETPQILTLFP